MYMYKYMYVSMYIYVYICIRPTAPVKGSLANYRADLRALGAVCTGHAPRRYRAGDSHKLTQGARSHQHWPWLSWTAEPASGVREGSIDG